MTQKNTDRWLAPGVVVSAQIYFGSKRRIGSSLTKSEYRARLRANAKLLSMALEEFHKHLSFDESTIIRLASLRKFNVRGQMDGTNKTATIRYRTGFKSMLETLAHEMVHAEQFHLGKLKYTWVDKKWHAIWNGKRNQIVSPNLPAYLELPWEQEAFRRQEALAAMVYVSVLRRYNELTDTEREVLQ